MNILDYVLFVLAFSLTLFCVMGFIIAFMAMIKLLQDIWHDHVKLKSILDENKDNKKPTPD